MPLPIISFIVNAILLVLALVLSIVILRSASIHEFNYGLTDIRERMKWIVLRCILALIVISFTAILFNVIVAVVQ